MSIEMSTDDVAQRVGIDPPEGSLRQRVMDNPRPALIWLAGVVVLILLEFGRIMSGLITFGSGAEFLFEGFSLGPGWVADNVADTLGPLAGDGAQAITAVFLLFILSIVIEWLLPFRLITRFDLDLSRRGERNLERTAITALFAIVAALLAFTPLNGIAQGILHSFLALLDSLASLPSLTSPETIPNLGHRSTDGGWSNTFLGLSPAIAWTIRVCLVLAYTGAVLAWAWKGYNIFRNHYREADWTPRDDTIRRFRNHYWGLFGFIVVLLFVVLAIWAPAISPVPVEHNVYEPYSYEFQYLTDGGMVESISHGTANIQTRSVGSESVGPLSYDQYDRWAPLGTTPRGQDMMTHLAYGARTSLLIGIIAIGLGALVAVVMSLVSAYYKGVVDILTILASDTIISIPALLLIMLLVIVFRDGDHWLAEPMDGGLLLALIFAFALWPGMWRAIRGPSLQVAEQEWVDAAKSYGQTPFTTMRKHMAPYVAGYIMIYASLLLGGIIIFIAALTFLGLGINPPTPEWGRLINQGESFIATQSWHVATISGLMIVLVVLGFNALGDGIRDAIDPETDLGRGGGTAAGGGG